MLKATNAYVCASIVPARSFLPNTAGIISTARTSCGMNASDSKLVEVGGSGEDEDDAEAHRYSSVLYGEKL